MRISDWSSDVCSSDLQAAVALPDRGANGFDDDDIRHGSNLPGVQRRRPDAASRTSSSAAAPMKATNTEPRSSSSKVSRSEEHTSELQSLMRTSYAVFCLKKKKITNNNIRKLQIKSQK